MSGGGERGLWALKCDKMGRNKNLFGFLNTACRLVSKRIYKHANFQNFLGGGGGQGRMARRPPTPSQVRPLKCDKMGRNKNLFGFLNTACRLVSKRIYKH